MTGPNQYTETVSAARIFSAPKFMVGYEITDGTPEPMRTNTGKTEFFPQTVVLTYEAKTLATRSETVEWALTHVLVKGPRLLASGKGTGSTVKWTDSGWPCIDADDLDGYPRWLVQLIMANMPKMVPFLGHESMTMETSWEADEMEWNGGVAPE